MNNCLSAPRLFSGLGKRQAMVEQENEPFICDLNCKLTQFSKNFSQPNITAESSESSGAVQGICFLPFENFHNFPSRSLHRPPLPGPERNRAATCLIAVNWMLNIAPNEFPKKKWIQKNIWIHLNGRSASLLCEEALGRAAERGRARYDDRLYL